MAEPIVVVIFLRGGLDGLSLIAPSGDADYVAARPGEIRVSRKGDEAGRVLDNAAADVDFRFHPQARGLSDLYRAGELAVFHAAGLNDATRSHFDAEARMESGATGAGNGGWLGRWLRAVRPEGALPALAIGAAAPDSLRGAAGIAVAEELSGLRLAGGHGYSTAIRAMMARRLGDNALIGAPLRRLLSLSETIEARVALDDDGNLRAYEPDVDYPDGPLGNSLRTLAQTIKLRLGLRVATVDYGGWDTHVSQAGTFNGLVDGLSAPLMAFWRDLGAEQERVTVVVMSEFGRRLKANESGGTDHGHGNAMMVLGPGVRGGRMYGRWPGLANADLDSGADLAITTDYRQILAELMAGTMGFADRHTLFPGLQQNGLLGFLR